MRSTTRRRVSPHIRELLVRDLEAVAEIEAMSFAPGWGRRLLAKVLRMPGVRGTVATDGGDIRGFLVCEDHADRIEILSMAVHPAWRRRYVGAALVWDLFGRLSLHGARAIGVDMRETNRLGTLFLAGCGFRAVGVKRGFFGDEEDAIRFEMRPAAGRLSLVR